ncbi:MAG: hypothetical protein OEQ13_14185, partial [Acidobacteriota bacterium]|nr:hypothetical protein [Acidobacteriota bacterium]
KDLVTIEAWPRPGEPRPKPVEAPRESYGRDRGPRRDSGPRRDRGPRGDRGPRRDSHERDRRPPAEPAGPPIELPELLPPDDVKEPPDVLRHVVQTMLTGLDLELTIADVSHSEIGYRVSLEGEDSGLLTDEKAEGLDAMQYLVNRMLHKDPREIGRVSIDAGGFRAKIEADLLEKARRVAEEVRESGEAQEMPPLGPFERRLVHLELAKHEDIKTASSGHGYKRCISVSLAGKTGGS